jgi:hypothetical protein
MLWHNTMGGGEGRMQRLTSLKVIDLIFRAEFEFRADPLTRLCGYGYGKGWTNLTRTRTPGQPAALTRGFLIPVTIPTPR